MMLNGRVVVVAGAAGSAGAATTRALRSAGATVIAVGHSPERLTALAASIPGINTEVADLSDPAAAAQLAARVRERHGRVDGLAHLIGGYRGGDGFTANSEEDWRFLSSSLIDTLRHEQARLSERIEFLTRNRDAIAAYVDKVLSVKAVTPSGAA